MLTRSGSQVEVEEVDDQSLPSVSDWRALIDSERSLRCLVEGVPQLLWRSCDKGRWTWASPQWLEYTGQTQEETHGRGWMAAVHPDDHAATLAAWEAARPHGILDVEFRVRRVADGCHVWHRTRSLPVRDAAGRIVEWLGSTTDIKDLKELQRRQEGLLADARSHAADLEAEVAARTRMQSRLLYMAHHDDLTRLYGRAFFLERLRCALRQSGSAGLRCAVVIMDLDRFKLVNDSLGHLAGDRLLIEVARRLKAATGPGAVLARIGGDEFALLLEEVTDTERVAGIAREIMDAMRKPLWLGEQEVFASCSIGVVQAAEQHMTPADVMRDADVAMYHAKQTDPGGYAVFTGPMRQAAVEALRLRTDLQNAVGRGEFFLEYQPICDAGTRGLVGVEALVRWDRPDCGTVAPAEFIGVAEETGLIRAIGRWVLGEACGQMQAWRLRFPGLTLRLSVNVSGQELSDPGFVERTRESLEATGLDPRSLELEVTESVFLREPERAAAALAALRALGVRIALDDFGTGYSALSYLDRFPMDTIKIDRSFVARMQTERRTRAIVDLVVRLSRAMEMDVVAEGIEDEGQLEALQRAGCGSVQGYLLGRPGPAAVITAALARRVGVARA